MTRVFIIFVLVLAGAAVLNIFSSHLMAIMNNVSVWWHVAGASIIVLILILIPDRHQSFSYVFTERFNNSGYADGSTTTMGFWFFIVPFGFLLTQYTITGFDASAHLSEETESASKAAAKGIWRSIFYSVLGGYILLLCVVFAIPDNADGQPDNALAGLGVAPIFVESLGKDWATSGALHLRVGAVLLRHVLHDLGLADDLRVQPRRSHPGLGDPEEADPQAGACQRGDDGGRRQRRPDPPGADQGGRQRHAGIRWRSTPSPRSP